MTHEPVSDEWLADIRAFAKRGGTMISVSYRPLLRVIDERDAEIARLRAAVEAGVRDTERLADVDEMLANLLYRVKVGIGDVPRAWVVEQFDDVLSVLRAARSSAPQERE